MKDRGFSWSKCTGIALAILLLVPALAAAQEDLPAPQFLFRQDDRLVLLDGYTGETSELPFAVTALDQFAWSPDGRYLLALLREEDGRSSCLNLYDVDALAWIDDQPVSCGLGQALFTSDSTRIFYATNDEINGTLWEYDLADAASQELYQTTSGTDLNPSWINHLEWSPTEFYLTFLNNHQIMGGTLNSLVVMNARHHTYISLSAPDTYYASYYPTWSADDAWFLVKLKDEHVTNGVMPVTNHEGDVYVVNTESGDSVRLTYTPGVSERNVHWTDDGGIAYSVFTEQKTTLTLEEALDVPEVPASEIVTPEPIDPQEYFRPTDTSDNGLRSPDPNITTWVTSDGHGQTLLSIGGYSADFSIPIADPTMDSSILIGWRPTDVSYPLG
ncbi:MAG: hypothetical protein IT320_06565 [Anaerolineae bacterium]|nr:hypothetical protein [Anaerolineae bacterium]